LGIHLLKIRIFPWKKRIENLKEITNFINIEEYEKFNYKELYILWKIRSENDLGIKNF
jgi:hypothetical protein